MRIGFQGVRGSFSDAAIRLYYGSEEHKDELKDSGYGTVGYGDFIKNKRIRYLHFEIVII